MAETKRRARKSELTNKGGKTDSAVDTATVQRAPHLAKYAFKKGQSGNPAGRPKGARSKLSEDFIKALADDFDEHGKAAIVTVRAEDPAKYLTIIGQLVPKDIDLNMKTDDAFVKLWEMVASGAVKSALEGFSTDDDDDAEALH